MTEKETEVIYIDTPEALDSAAKIWKDVDELGIDLECENNLHHYGSYIALIQISSRKQDWIVDVLELKEIKKLISILENKSIVKVFHDVGFDLRILKHEFNCQPKNIFDSQMAAVLLGKEDIGLGPLLAEYFDVKKERKFQMADWTKRPLTPDMISYASKDTQYLLKLKDQLTKELKAKKRFGWAEEEFKNIEAQDFEYHESTFWSIKGLKDLNDRDRSVLKKLFNLREKFAKLKDRPVHYIISTRRLKDIAQSPPRSIGEWKGLKGVHPVIKYKAHEFYEAVRKGRASPLKMPVQVIKRYTKEQRDLIDALDVKRKELAEKLDIKPHILLNNEQMRDIVLTRKLTILRKWQKDILDIKDMVSTSKEL